MNSIWWKRSWWTVLVVLIGTAPVWGAGTITGISTDPAGSVCAGASFDVTVEGMGPGETCTILRINFDEGVAAPMTYTDVALPFTVTSPGYGTTGTKTIRATGGAMSDCVGDVTTTVDVQRCVIAEFWDGRDFFFFPRIEDVVGFMQPGNPLPIIVWGRGFGSQPGQLFLQGNFGVIPIEHLEWSENGNWISFFMPDICGVNDHTAVLYVQTLGGLTSNFWSEPFVAKRDVLPVARDKASVLSCGHDSNKDCCNGECDPDDTWYFSTCDSTTTLCGFHLNAWLAVGDDVGSDRYRVDIRPSKWVIEDVSFNANLEPGEVEAHLDSHNAIGQQVSEFEVDWEVTQNDDLHYTVQVFMSGPCGTSPDFSISAAAAASGFMFSGMDARSNRSDWSGWERLRELRRRVQKEDMGRALKVDRETQAKLAELRAAVTEESIAEARKLDEIQRVAGDLYRRSMTPGADQDQINREIEELKKRLQAFERGKARRPRE